MVPVRYLTLPTWLSIHKAHFRFYAAPLVSKLSQRYRLRVCGLVARFLSAFVGKAASCGAFLVTAFTFTSAAPNAGLTNRHLWLCWRDDFALWVLRIRFIARALARVISRLTSSSGKSTAAFTAIAAVDCYCAVFCSFPAYFSSFLLRLHLKSKLP